MAFDTTGLGAMSSVWGSGPNDVYVVGGSGGPGLPLPAEIYHYDGATWRTIDVSGTGAFVLVWVFGFGPNDVYAVGLGGTVLHYDGVNWTKLDAGTTKSLWGIWGASPTDIWIVGEGSNFGDPEPTIIHYDGSGLASGFTAYVLPYPAQNDRDARDLFKVWGIGSKVFAVGAAGLIVEYDSTNDLWFQVFGGANANEDFVSLWGTSDNNIVAVGGRSGARISDFNGSSWTTLKPSGVGGLNAVFMDDPAMAIAGGVGGYVCHYNPATDPATDVPVAETAPTTTDIHAIWGDGAGRYYAVGGDFSFPFSDGVCLVRTYGDPGITPVPPVGP